MAPWGGQLEQPGALEWVDLEETAQQLGPAAAGRTASCCASGPGDPSEAIRVRVMAARDRQLERFAG